MRIVGDAITDFLADRAQLASAVQESGGVANCIPNPLRIVSRWRGQMLDVELGRDEITIVVDLAPFIGEPEALIRHGVPTRLKPRGVERRLVPLAFLAPVIVEAILAGPSRPHRREANQAL